MGNGAEARAARTSSTYARSLDKSASGGARPYLDDVRMQQVAVIDELTLDVLSNFAASFHQFDGNLLTRGTVHSQLHLTIATRVYVLQYPVFRLSTQWVRLGHLSSRQELLRTFGRAAAPTSLCTFPQNPNWACDRFA